MRRRQFLALSAAATFMAGQGLATAAPAAASPVMISVVLTDISAQTAQEPLVETVRALLSNGISVTCGLVLPVGQAMTARFVQTVLALTEFGAGVEFALHVPNFGGQSTYFQSRAAFQAQQRFAAMVQSKGAAVTVSTILCDDAEAVADPTGSRAAGIRNILVRPKQSQKTRTETWPQGVVRFYGGQLTTFENGIAALPDPATDENIQLFYLSAKALETVEAQQFAQGRSDFIDTLFGAQVAGQAALMSISDLQLRDDFRYQRLMVILIEVPKDSAPQVLQNAVDFQAKLASLGRPSCLMQAGETMWVHNTAAAAQLQPIKVANGMRSGSYIATDAPIEFGYGLAFSAEPSARFGLDGFAVLQVPTTPLPRPDPSLDAASQLAGVADLAVTIAPDQLDFAATRAETLSTLLALGDDGVTVFVDLYDFAERLYPSGFIEKRHQLTIAAQVNAPFQTPPRRDEAERARLLADAQRAWTYFDKYTNSATGLCPSTVDIRQYGDILQAVTMWDVGSNINALVAATEMGIITEKQLFSAIKRILPNIKGRTTKGVTLPPGWLKTDRIRSGDRNFDGCDTGRLLSALHNLRLRYGMTKELEAVVAGWDLQTIIVNREIHSVVEGRLESTFASHCGHYAAVAFRHWGFDVASPYETFTTPSPADGEMRLLEAASRIGSFGAEPLLLEAMELGMSREGAFLAEVLSTAQKEEFDSTGRLICVSETPIDTAPWFVYEGLQVGSALRAWRLNGDDKTKTQPVAPVGQDEMVFVTKAAFLWAAYKPCVHSSKLLAYARAHAAGEIGFASNVNQVTQAANLDYTDINTNAVILQSIAHMLRVS